MKNSSLQKLILAGAVLAGLTLAPRVRADVEVVIAGGNASSAVLFDRATNLFGGVFSSTYGLSSSTVRTYVGTIPGYTTGNSTNLGNVTLDFVLNGAVQGLQDIEDGNPQLTAKGTAVLPPTLVDSSSTPDAAQVDPSVLNSKPVYAVPYVFIKNISANSADSAAITNLTARQAIYLETAGATIPSTFFGGAGTNPVYFIGRNSGSAVRTEVDANIGNSSGILTYYTNGLSNVPQLDQSADPGLSSGSAVYNTVLAVTNSIGTVAVQNAKSGAARLQYEGVPYSYSNVINGSYPLWYYENYYTLNSQQAGTPSAAQQAVLNLFYTSITNAAYTTSSVYTNNYIPEPALLVKRGLDGTLIKLK
jgi:hypothetical protein